MVYTIALKVWNIAKWICLVFIIPTSVDLFKSAVTAKKPEDILPHSFLFGSGYRTLTLSTLTLLFAIACFARIVMAIGKYLHGDKPLRQYLRLIVEANQGLNPKGFAQQSQALISVNVPLNDIFIHLRAVPDRPIHDVPSEQQKLLEELRQRSDLTPEELEERIQQLRIVWHSQLGQEQSTVLQERKVAVEEVLQQLKAVNSVAIILGAPGSGKSTAMRWLALQMAYASLKRFYHLPRRLSPGQIPILLRISDYAKLVSTENLSFEQFFKEEFAKLHPNLPISLLEALEKGRCLLLFDGLDEVASDNLRRRIAEAISTFISKYSSEKASVQYYNRFIVTSRIVGYEPGIFAQHAHYTLLDLEDQQIEQFLTNWCPAVERYQAMFAQGMRKLTSQQEVQAEKLGDEQRDRLQDALKNNPSIKRLAINPLMLTILALIQRSGRTLPHRRVELYQIVTRTLLDNWNQETGRKIFSVEEIPLAEQLLIDLAYRLHNSDPVLAHQDVKEIAYLTMTEFYGHPPKETDIEQFIETLRSSSGLFVESGQGLFSFMHRTFQEYFVALYLLRKSQVDLKQFVVEHYSIAIWREPILLAMAYKSGQSSRSERQGASELIQAIEEASDLYDTILHRNLLFAANSIVDCSAWSIDKALQERIANHLFDLYGDSLASGRYSQLQQDIEKVALLWLRGQPQGSTQQNILPPLLKVWHAALCNAKNPLRQEGAVRLLASIAPDLQNGPKVVLHTLLPPLLQLAGLQDWYLHDLFCPEEIRTQLFQQAISPSSIQVEEFALAALRLLNASGPAGWLHNDWLRWCKEQPELLGLLTQHARELNYTNVLEFNYLILPKVLPSKGWGWYRKLKILNFWTLEPYVFPIIHKIQGRPKPRDLLRQILYDNDVVNYPHAYLLKQMLERELTQPKDQSWSITWNTFLQQEMTRGHSATYQICLNLRLLLCWGNQQQCQEIVEELMEVLSSLNQQFTQALIAVSASYIQNVDTFQNDEIYTHHNVFQFFQSLRDIRFLRDQQYSKGVQFKEVQYQRDLRYLINALIIQNQYTYLIPDAEYLQEIQYYPSCIVFIYTIANGVAISTISNSSWGYSTRYIYSEDSWFEKFVYRKYYKYIGITRNIIDLLDADFIIDTLTRTLMHKMNELPSTVLLALYSIVTGSNSISSSTIQQVQQIIQTYIRESQEKQPLSREHRQLIEIISQRIGILPPSPHSTLHWLQIHETPDARAQTLLSLKQQPQLSKKDLTGLLALLTDTTNIKQLASDKQKKLSEIERQFTNEYIPNVTIGYIAWLLLFQSFDLQEDALSFAVEVLEYDAIYCAAAALLLRSCKTLSLQAQKEAMLKIMEMLADDERLLRPLDPPDKTKIWRLDDVLFETLKALTEKR